MTYRAPTCSTDYMALFMRNQRVEGYGEKTKTICPCPFCAAPDFMVLGILTAPHDMTRGGTCRECGRSAKAIFSGVPADQRIEIVQTGGDDPPEWMEPKMRRVA